MIFEAGITSGKATFNFSDIPQLIDALIATISFNPSTASPPPAICCAVGGLDVLYG
jgi:hypothetical protein